MSVENHNHNHHRDVQREQHHPNQHARIDSNQLQRGAQHGDHQNHAKADLHKHGFPETKLDGADHKDRHFQPSSRMNAKPEAKDQQNAADKHPVKPEQKPEQKSEGTTKPAESKEAAAKEQSRAKEAQEQKTRGFSESGLSDMSLSNAKTTHKPDGTSNTQVQDANTFKSIDKDKSGNIRQITDHEKGKPDRTTTYDASGKPASETVGGNGTRTWDSHGKLTSDTRTDKSENTRPDALTTKKNSDGSTTVTSGSGDTHTHMNFDKDGNMKSMQEDRKESLGGHELRTKEFSSSGQQNAYSLEHRDANGKMTDRGAVRYDQNGTLRQFQHDDAYGHKAESWDEKGRWTSKTDVRPGTGYTSVESRDQAGNYSSYTRDKGHTIQWKLSPDGSVVDFKHEYQRP